MGTVCVRPMENSLLGDFMSSETAGRDGSNIFLLLKKKKSTCGGCVSSCIPHHGVFMELGFFLF